MLKSGKKNLKCRSFLIAYRRNSKNWIILYRKNKKVIETPPFQVLATPLQPPPPLNFAEFGAAVKSSFGTFSFIYLNFRSCPFIHHLSAHRSMMHKSQHYNNLLSSHDIIPYPTPPHHTLHYPTPTNTLTPVSLTHHIQI